MLFDKLPEDLDLLLDESFVSDLPMEVVFVSARTLEESFVWDLPLEVLFTSDLLLDESFVSDLPLDEVLVTLLRLSLVVPSSVEDLDFFKALSSDLLLDSTSAKDRLDKLSPLLFSLLLESDEDFLSLLLPRDSDLEVSSLLLLSDDLSFRA